MLAAILDSGDATHNCGGAEPCRVHDLDRPGILGGSDSWEMQGHGGTVETPRRAERARGKGGAGDPGAGREGARLAALGEQPGQGGKYRPVCPVQPRSRVLPPQHCDLVAEHQQLGVLRRRRACQQRHPPSQADDLLEKGELAEFDSWTPHWMAREGGGSAHEVRTWIAAFASLAATGPYELKSRFYEAIPAWIAGFAVATALGR